MNYFSIFLCFVFPTRTRPHPNEEKFMKNFLCLGQNEAKKISNFLCFHAYTYKLIGQYWVRCTCTHKPPRKNSGYAWTKQNWIFFQSQLTFSIFLPFLFCFANEAKKNWKIIHHNLAIEYMVLDRVLSVVGLLRYVDIFVLRLLKNVDIESSRFLKSGAFVNE